jgi:hypothetical protein
MLVEMLKLWKMTTKLPENAGLAFDGDELFYLAESCRMCSWRDRMMKKIVAYKISG